MSARDELANLSYLSMYPKSADAHRIQPLHERAAWEIEMHERAADAILAAGYTKPRTITTAEELDEVALLTVIRSAGGVVCEWYAGYWQEAGVRDCRTSAEIELPATVLYEPAP